MTGAGVLCSRSSLGVGTPLGYVPKGKSKLNVIEIEFLLTIGDWDGGVVRADESVRDQVFL